MKHLPGVASTAVLVLMALAGSAHAQGRDLLPGEVPPQREADGPEQLPQPPPDQFGACVGMTDRGERDACVKRETEKRNPATRTAPKEPTRPPESPPQR